MRAEGTRLVEAELFRYIMSGLTHNLGGVAGALQMRSAALALGSDPSTAGGVMRTAATELTRVVSAMRILQGVAPNVGAALEHKMSAAAWSNVMYYILPMLLGKGYVLANGANSASLPTDVAQALSYSVLCFARSLAGEPSQAQPTHLVVVALDVTATADSISVRLGTDGERIDSATQQSNEWHDERARWKAAALDLADENSFQLSIAGDGAEWVIPGDRNHN